jgi:hypothetical protein
MRGLACRPKSNIWIEAGETGTNSPNQPKPGRAPGSPGKFNTDPNFLMARG